LNSFYVPQLPRVKKLHHAENPSSHTEQHPMFIQYNLTDLKVLYPNPLIARVIVLAQVGTFLGYTSKVNPFILNPTGVAAASQSLMTPPL
jgi:hypothetical protein